MSLTAFKLIPVLLLLGSIAARHNDDSTYEVVLTNFEDNKPRLISTAVSEVEEPEKNKRKGRKKPEYYPEDWTEVRSEDEAEPPKETPTPTPQVVQTTSKGQNTSAPSSSKSQASGTTSYVSNRYITIYPTAAAPRLKGAAAGSMGLTLLLATAPVLAFALAFLW